MSKGIDADKIIGFPPSSRTLNRMASAKGWPAKTDETFNADTEHERTRPCGTKKEDDTAGLTCDAFVWKKNTNVPMDDMVMFSKVAMPFKEYTKSFP